MIHKLCSQSTTSDHISTSEPLNHNQFCVTELIEIYLFAMVCRILAINLQTFPSFLFFSFPFFSFSLTFSHCQRLHKVLDDTRPQMWEIQDRLRTLQKKGCCQTSPNSRLLMRWKDLHNQLQQKIHSTQTFRKNYERFEKNTVTK